MNDSNNLSDNTYNIFDFDVTKNLPENKRYAVRYIRSNIKASIHIVRLFGFGKKYIPMKLLDISSKGALISSKKKIHLNKKVALILKFEDGKIFKISSKIVRIEQKNNYHYGVKFDRFNHKLGNYLLKTQSDLVFR